MNKINYLPVILGFTLLPTGCKLKHNGTQEILKKENTKLLTSRYQEMLDYPVDSLSMPRSMSLATGEIKKVPSKDWCSGFFPGNLWQIY